MSVLESVLATGLARNVLSPEQADALRSIAAEATVPAAPPPEAMPLPRERRRADPALPAAGTDEEAVRFVNGFGDVFVTIGLVLFVGALVYFAARWGGMAPAGAAAAAAGWLLAEYFTRVRRMALPSIVLLLAFAGGLFVAAFYGASGQLFGAASLDTLLSTPAGWTRPLAIAAVATAIGTLLHYLRFRVPMTVAAGVAALLLLAFVGAQYAAPEWSRQHTEELILLCGVAAFAAALAFDAADPLRTRRESAIAFWLHLLAAPLIVHTLVGPLVRGGTLDTPAATKVLAIFAALAVLAILIDRRAMLVSALAYAGIAFGAIIANLRVGIADQSVPLTVLVLGGLVLLLSALWTPLRRLFFAVLPDSLTRRLPHPLPVPAGRGRRR